MQAVAQTATSKKSRTFQTMRELNQFYEKKYRALREDGRRAHERYLQERRKLNEQRRAAGESPEKYQRQISQLREQYYREGQQIWLKRMSLGSKHCHDEAKLFFELEEKKKQEKKEREIDARSSYQGGGIALILFLFMLACSLYVFYITVTTPNCKDTGEKVMHVLFFGALDVFCIMGTYVGWMYLTYSREEWAKVIDDEYKFNEEQKRKKEDHVVIMLVHAFLRLLLIYLISLIVLRRWILLKKK